MACLANPQSITPPDLSQEELYRSWINSNPSELRIAGILQLHAVFKGTYLHPITPKTKARYDIQVYIPLNDPMFNTDKMIGWVYASQLPGGSHVNMEFSTYIGRNGYAQSWVE